MDLNGVKVNSLLSSPLPQPHNTGMHAHPKEITWKHTIV